MNWREAHQILAELGHKFSSRGTKGETNGRICGGFYAVLSSNLSIGRLFELQISKMKARKMEDGGNSKEILLNIHEGMQ